MKNSEDVAKKLNELLTRNYDSEKGFKNAADDIKNEGLKNYFKEKAQQRYDFGHELKAEIRNFGGTPDKGSSVAGDAHRVWMDLKSTVAGGDEEAVLEEVIRGEKKAIDNYNDVITGSELPPSTENLLIKQKKGFEKSLDEAKALENTFD